MSSKFKGSDEPVEHERCYATRDPYVLSHCAIQTRGCLRNIELVRIRVFDRNSVGVFPTSFTWVSAHASRAPSIETSLETPNETTNQYRTNREQTISFRRLRISTRGI